MTASTRRRRRGGPAEVAAVVLGAGAALLVGADGSPGWQIARIAVAIGVAVAIATVTAAGFTGSRRRAAGRAVVLVGAIAIAVGIGIGVRHALVAGPVWRSFAGLAVLAAGVVLVVDGTRRAATGRSRPWRVAEIAASTLAVAVTVWIAAPGIAAVNVPPTDLGAATMADHGVTVVEVELRADDGARLAAWYAPSTNGAAVVVRHGAGSTRTAVVDQAAVLARHGYGVLLTDARGHGESEGRGMDFGWYGDADIDPAVTFLAARPDVDRGRIAVVGLSMGGEEAIGAAAADARIAAVVAEGATGRSDADAAWLDEEYGWRGRVQQGVEWLRFAITDALTSAPRPTSLADAVRDAAPRPFLLIAAGEVGDEVAVAEMLADVGRGHVEVWVVPGAGHTQGLATDPAGWERRVIGFLDAALS